MPTIERPSSTAPIGGPSADRLTCRDAGRHDGAHAPRTPVRGRAGSRRRASPTGPAATLLAIVLASFAGTSRLAGQAPATSTADRGIGIVAFDLAVGPGLEPPFADTLVVRGGPSSDAPVVARFIFRVPEPFTWSYDLEVREDGLIDNSLEFGDEELGLPLDSIGPAGGWARVVFAFAPDGAPRLGWVDTDLPGTLVRSWPDVLAERPLFLLTAGAPLGLFDSPGGAAVGFEPERVGPDPDAPFDFRLDPLEIDGRWMRVRVVSPHDGCSAEPLATRSAEGWIEFLDARKRPLVWYHSRGC